MSATDIVTATVFIACVLLGLAAKVVQDMLRNRPRQRMQTKLAESTALSKSTTDARMRAELRRAQREARRRRRQHMLGGTGHYLGRLDVMGGENGATRLAVVVLAVMCAGLLLWLSGFIPRTWAALLAVLLVCPVIAAVLYYRWLVARFKKRFLAQLPDAMDMIVRASQAGVPVTQSIRTIGQRFEAPLGPEFLKIGNSLLLGNDLQDVMDDAVTRIELPDFSFFSVCILLQRDAGGSVAEALENLSSVIRSRRDIALKARALTAESRMSSMIMSALPFIVMALLYTVNREYVKVLFTTQTGHKLLLVAAVMLTIGVGLIAKLSRLKV